jgi:drug/metabolite transporter (DMT)-like permease
MLKGIGLKIGATFAFALMSTLIKAVAPTFPVSVVVFFRSVFALVTLSAWLAWRGEFPAALRTSRPLGHVGRSFAGSGGMFANFFALTLLPLADATAFTFAAPLIVVPLASIVLGEEVRFARGAAVVAGFVGVLVMLSDHLSGGAGSTQAGLGATVALCGAGFTAAAMIQTRRLTRSEATGAIVFYFSLLTAIISFAAMIVAGLWPDGGAFARLAVSQRLVAPAALEAVALVSIGLLGGCGQILMTHSFRYAEASIIAAFDYVAMIWAAAFGLAIFGETPSSRVVLGAVIVVVAGIAMLWREHERSKISLTAPAEAADNIVRYSGRYRL